MRRFLLALVFPIILFSVRSAYAQTKPSAPPVVLIRNVLIGSESGTVKTTAMVVNGRVVPVNDDLLAPIGAVIIDGGGNHLTVGADGTIKLKPSSADIATCGVTNENIANHNRALVSTTTNTNIATQQAAPTRDEGLSAKVVDPTAPLKTITFQNKFSPSLWGLDDQQNDIDTQIAIPFKFLGRANIMRITIPYNTSMPFEGQRGLGDTAIFDIFLFPKKWGTLALGPVATLNTNKGPGVDTFAIGPAIGTIFKHKKLTYGVFSQNLFSAESIATSQIQPVIAYTVNKHLSVAFGDQQFTYDWHKDRFVFAPVGFQLNYITHFGEQPVRFIFGPQYNIKNEFGSRKWTITSGVSLILP